MSEEYSILTKQNERGEDARDKFRCQIICAEQYIVGFFDLVWFALSYLLLKTLARASKLLWVLQNLHVLFAVNLKENYSIL